MIYPMEFIAPLVNIILHLDTYLTTLVATYGVATYAILFGVIFAETGFVITPFLPGDSLLFTAGAVASLGSLHISVLIILLLSAAVAGDTLNYWIGHYFGQKIVDNPRITFINQEHIDKTEQFFKKYGGKTIILARFVPIVRTFAPFVAGIGTMNYRKFILYNILGGALWVTILTGAGYFFGNLPVVKKNFELVIFAIVGLSVMPMIYEYVQNKRHPDVPSVPAKQMKKILKK